MTDFLVWQATHREGTCVIKSPEGIRKAYQLNKGVSRLADWPANVVCGMDPDFPKDTALTDNLYGAGFKVISNAIKEVLEAQQIENIEYLPVAIKDHNARVVSEEYFIMNPLTLVDCVDIEASEVTWNAINENVISDCKQLALRSDRLGDDHKVFRLESWPRVILANAQIVRCLEDAAVGGLHFVEPSRYTGF